MFTSRMSAKGQITIPKEVREAIKLRSGDRVWFELHNQAVLLKRIDPYDVAFHNALSETLDEWNSPENEEAFHDL